MYPSEDLMTLLTAATVARLLGVSKSTVNAWNLDASHPLKGVRLSPRIIRYRRADVLRLLAQGRGR